jgi:hypothetical protein
MVSISGKKAATLAGSDIESSARQVAVTYRPIEQLKLNPDNPRIHSDKQIRKISRSIAAFGPIVPVLVDKNSQVIAGHGRVLAAKLLGLKELPTICAELTEEQAKAFAIADNRLTECSVWDYRLLAEQLKVLSEVELNFSLEATGFELGEIDVLVDNLQPGANDDRIADAVPGAEPGIRVTVPGDLWLLGGSRVLCADSFDTRSYSRIMEGQKARMVLNDPPDLAPNSAEEELIDFYTRVFNLLISQSVEGSIHFVFADWRQMTEVLIAGKHVYGELNDLCIGVKDKAEAGSLYRRQHELVFVFKAGRDCQKTAFQAKPPGSDRSNVWRYPRSKSRSRATHSGSLTTRPVSVVADAIVDCSSTGDVVLDTFLGNGTTVIAAEQTGRICYGIEIDPKVVDTMIRRWQTFTGLTAKHGISGRTFRECEQEVVREFKR